MSTVGTEIFWPWYTLIGAVVTIGVAWLMTLMLARHNLPRAEFGAGG